MARQTKPLSVKEIESAKPKEADYVLYDGDGLELKTPALQCQFSNAP